MGEGRGKGGFVGFEAKCRGALLERRGGGMGSRGGRIALQYWGESRSYRMSMGVLYPGEEGSGLSIKGGENEMLKMRNP